MNLDSETMQRNSPRVQPRHMKMKILMVAVGNGNQGGSGREMGAFEESNGPALCVTSYPSVHPAAERDCGP